MAALDAILDSLYGDAPVRDVRVCLRAATVWSRRLGLASVLPPSDCAADEEPRSRLSGRSARELADLARSRDRVEAAVGIAAVNSLLDVDPAVLEEGNAYDRIVRLGREGTVVLVGHFPFVERMRADVRRLHVLELRPSGDDLAAREAPRVVPQADVVAITGTALLNHTLDGLLELARGRHVILLGPSTPLAPVLFDHGVHTLCGTLVTDPDAALQCISEGVRFRDAEGLRRVIWSRDQVRPSRRRT